MASVWGELKRRNVVKVAVAYAIVGWLLIEVASTIFPLLQLPDWTATFVTVLLIMGFPIAMILSWAYELTPDGMKRSKRVPASEHTTHSTGRKLDFAIIGALAVALGFVIYNYVLGDISKAPPEMAAIEPGVLSNSVAVLPLDNLSPDPDNAYFASGLHEEILNQLAKLSNLSVISRTSVLQYAENRPTIREIADALNVQSIMEGSVRYAGSRIRVTAQLIDPETGAHLWSETYDRDFDDIFAIESDIAMNIANALQAEFSLEEQESIERPPTDSPAAYALYLRALSSEALQRSVIEDLDSAIALDPEFALAYALKAVNHAYVVALTEETERVIREDAERALQLDPTLGIAHVALGLLHESRWRVSEAHRAFEQAYRLSPNDPIVLGSYAIAQRLFGDSTEAVRLAQKAVELDPNNPAGYGNLGLSYQYAGELSSSAVALRRAIEMDPSAVRFRTQLALTEATLGNAENALIQLEVAEQFTQAPLRLAQMAVAYSKIGRVDDAVRVFRQFEAQAQEMPVDDATWALVLIGIGEYDQAQERLANVIENQGRGSAFSFGDFRVPLTAIKANFWRDPALDTPQFRELRDRIFALN